MDSDEEDYVFFGTPIEREEEITNRRKKAAAESSGNLRSVVPWKQEVRDEEGRRRFHGAFTGGFSAGYYNTVGSKEGWAPQSFTSSRKNRAEVKQQSIFSFLDDDEKAELEGQHLGTSSQFDTFGFTAAEYARKQADKEQKQRLVIPSVMMGMEVCWLRPSAIPGPVPDELVVPAAESIGVKLLLKMGWRHGRTIKDSHASSLYDARREARKAFLAFASDITKASHPADYEPVEDEPESLVEQPTVDDAKSSQSLPVFVLNPKEDLHGLGYDPFKHAPEFRGKAAPGFGIGALEEFDAEDEDVYTAGKYFTLVNMHLRVIKVYWSLWKAKLIASETIKMKSVTFYGGVKKSYFVFPKYMILPSFCVCALGYDFEETYVEEDEEPSRLSIVNKQKVVVKDQGVLPGFKLASVSDYQLERFDPPIIPKDFVPHHKFPGPLETLKKLDIPSPPEVPPPDDNNLKLLIEGVATLVARCGKLFEDLSRKKNQSNPLFSFLSGGNGHDYYARKLWEEHQKRGVQGKLPMDEKLTPSMQKMTAESRGKLLGEKPLERSSKETTSSSIASGEFAHLQSNLTDTFTKPASFSELPEVAKPFKDDPAKQARFERFLKEKYEGGLRSTGSSSASNMSEGARARERLDFEAAAEAIEKAKSGKGGVIPTKPFDFLATGMQFTSGGLEQVKDAHVEDLLTKKMYPRREEFQWRPMPILCKRFDLIDPYMGKPPPAPRMRSKMDSLLFMPDSIKGAKLEEDITNRDLPVAETDAQKTIEDAAEKNIEVEVEVENVERPVDLYKAIFSDDSDDDVEDSKTNKVGDPEKKIEVATTTLNRLIAGDFLESLGKELGLEVPPDMPYSTNKASSRTETRNGDAENAKIRPDDGRISYASNVASGTSEILGQENAQEGESPKNESIPGSSGRYSSKNNDDLSENVFDKRYVEKEKSAQKDRKPKSPSKHSRNWSSSSSSEDERSRKHSRRQRYRSSDSYSDSSTDHRDRSRSRSKVLVPSLPFGNPELSCDRALLFKMKSSMIGQGCSLINDMPPGSWLLPFRISSTVEVFKLRLQA
ncbi:SWAP/Surp [Corchorus capsularis]|uniref:SWAP/Surp n=1 Tax=Corchorus capsularis TaxID=210143 RepID=A0A1R3G1K6_COCAP|nr:SWAP/Surp [Corchorus capsularis]